MRQVPRQLTARSDPHWHPPGQVRDDSLDAVTGIVVDHNQLPVDARPVYRAPDALCQGRKIGRFTKRRYDDRRRLACFRDLFSPQRSVPRPTGLPRALRPGPGPGGFNVRRPLPTCLWRVAQSQPCAHAKAVFAGFGPILRSRTGRGSAGTVHTAFLDGLARHSRSQPRKALGSGPAGRSRIKGGTSRVAPRLPRLLAVNGDPDGVCRVPRIECQRSWAVKGDSRLSVP